MLAQPGACDRWRRALAAVAAGWVGDLSDSALSHLLGNGDGTRFEGKLRRSVPTHQARLSTLASAYVDLSAT